MSDLDKLEKLEQLLLSSVDQIKAIKNNNIKLVPESNTNKTKESKVLSAIRKYLDSYYVESEFGRIPTTLFHSAILESLKESGFTVDIRHIPTLMLYVFDYKRIKSGG